jgi:hypothetical protein
VQVMSLHEVPDQDDGPASFSEGTSVPAAQMYAMPSVWPRAAAAAAIKCWRLVGWRGEEPLLSTHPWSSTGVFAQGLSCMLCGSPAGGLARSAAAALYPWSLHLCDVGPACHLLQGGCTARRFQEVLVCVDGVCPSRFSGQQGTPVVSQVFPPQAQGIWVSV